MKIMWLVLLLVVFSIVTISAQFAGGSGTEADPWHIATRTQLEQLNNYLGADHSDKHFLQTADIDLGGAPWIPIGRTTPFYGEYDGDGHNIGNLNISDYLGGPSGLFAYIVDATIENVFLINVWLDFSYNFYNQTVWSADNIAPLVVYSNNSYINNCHTTGYVSVNAVNGCVSYISGLVCHIEGGQVFNSSANCTINLGSHWEMLGDPTIYTVGGIACENSGTISHCVFSGSIYCMALSIVAPDNMGYITDIGGVTASNSGSIVNCRSSGDIQGGSSTGGLLGMNGGTISSCWSNCVVYGNSYGQGGLVGVNLGVVDDSYAYGSIELGPLTNNSPGYDGWGGFAGYNGGSINSSFSYSYVSYEYWQVGGFVGSNYGGVAECYWNIDNINENTSMGGGEARTSRVEAGVSLPPSSNRACGFPAHGFPTKFIVGIHSQLATEYLEGSTNPYLDVNTSKAFWR